MELQRLKKYNKEYAYFQREIDSLQSYLERKQRETPVVRVNPEQLAKALAIPALDILYILSLAADEKLMKRKFLVYSDNHDFLGSFESTNTIPDELPNKQTGEAVEKDHFYVDLVFELANEGRV